jgi:colanic acid/amylovoran biosynthesis glycosyltransferase
MKVLYVTKKVPFGSTEAFLFPEIEDHLRNGWDIMLAPVQVGELIHERGAALLPHTLRMGLFSGEVLAALATELSRRPRKVLATLKLLFRCRKPAILLKNVAVWPKGVWLGSKIRELGIEHIHAHWIAVPATLALIASRLSGVPMSITAHRYDIAAGNLIPEKVRASKFTRAIDEAGSAELAAQLSEDDPDPIVIHMGVEICGATAGPRPGKLNRAAAVMAARMVPKKAHEIAIQAVAIANNAGTEVTLELFGDGPLKEHLVTLADRLGVSELVRFNGQASHEALLERLRSGAYDFGVLPSVTAEDGDKEGIPVFLMEAMAAGLPVVSTPNGGTLELIGGGAGVIVEERDAEALASAMISLADDECLRRTLSEAGRARILSSFMIERCCALLRSEISR